VDTYSHKFSDILDVQDEIVARILEGLSLRLSLEEQQRIAKRYTDNPEAYRLYKQARQKSLNNRLPEALADFNRALELDRNYALAIAGKAEALLYNGGLLYRDTGPKAKELATNALTLDPSLSEAHCAIALALAYVDWDWDNSEKRFRQARNLDPSSECVYENFGIVLTMIGRLEQGLGEIRAAVRADERAASRHFSLGEGLYWAGDNQQALVSLAKAAELDPGNPLTPLMAGIIYAQQGQHEKAVKEHEKISDTFIGKPVFIGYDKAVAGKRAEALAILNEFERREKSTVDPWAMSILNTALDRKDAAFEWLNRCRDERFIILGSISVDPVFDSLRSDARFAKLLQDLRLEPISRGLK
jgi:Tfp pilus assembly protein PilF